MSKIEGKILVDSNLPKEMTYEKISSIEDYEDSRCVMVNTMDPDLFMIFGKIDCIISKRGSKLSHLAILAREYGKTLILADSSDLKEKGNVAIEKDGDTVSISTA